MSDKKSQFRELENDIVVFHNKNEIPYISVPHLHSQYEIYYNIRGAKGFMLDSEFYRCGERDLIIIPKIMAHKAIVKKNVEYERCIINVDDKILDMIEKMCEEEDGLAWIRESGKKPKMVNLSEEEHREYLNLIEDYNKEKDRGENISALAVFVHILSFLKGCFENPKRTEYLDTETLTYADKVMGEIEHDFKTISVSEAAGRVFIDKDYANRLFKEETGMNIKTYLTMRRIAEAKKYLFLGKSVKEAGVLSGFYDYSNFLRIFRKYEGYPPKSLQELTKPI